MKYYKIMTINKALAAVSIIILLAGQGWTQEPVTTQVATTIPQTPEELLARLGQLPQELPHWALLPQPDICDRTCLVGTFPEEAQEVLSYNFLWSVTVKLQPAEPQDKTITADIFRMDEDLDAYGLFARKYGITAVPAQITTRSYWTGDQLHIWRGMFYIRLTPEAVDPVLRAAVLAAGRGIAAKLPLPDQLPLMMRLMPEGRVIAPSLRYYRQNVLGQLTLGDGLLCQYQEDDSQFTLALLRSKDAAAAAKVFATVTALISATGPATPVPDLGKQAMVIQSSQYGLSYVMWEGAYVAVALGVRQREMGEGLLRITAINIRISRF